MTSVPTDEDICNAAIARLGCVGASVFEQDVSERAARGSDDAGVWFCLSTKPNDREDWQVTARRRSKLELLQFLTN
jgi:hypothetical protein